MLAPPRAEVTTFHQICESSWRHSELLKQTQQLRGRVYVEDGAIPASKLTSDGRHVQQADYESWHLLTLEGEQVAGCMRVGMRPGAVRYEDLGVSGSALAKSNVWGKLLRTAVESELACARERGIGYAEIGGWALSGQLRGSIEAFRTCLMIYALKRLLGGALSISTATRRHGSSSILQRMGGRPLAAGGRELPPYFDPQYGCEMEILRFDHARPNPKYEDRIGQCEAFLAAVPVVMPQQAKPSSLKPLRNAVAANYNVPLTNSGLSNSAH